MKHSDAQDPDKRYWWLVLVIVPLATAIIALIPAWTGTPDPNSRIAEADEEVKLQRDRERFYWDQMNRLLQILESRVGVQSDRFRFSKYYEGCTFSFVEASGQRFNFKRSDLRLAGLVPSAVSSLGLEIGFDGLREDSDEAFETLNVLGEALSKPELSPYVFLIEASSERIRNEREAILYTQIAADAIREYLVARFSIARCRLIARGSGGVPSGHFGKTLVKGDTLIIQNFGRRANG